MFIVLALCTPALLAGVAEAALLICASLLDP
jgi:hypothetical protein